MKGTYKAKILTAWILCAMLLTACTSNTNNNEKSETSVLQVSQISEISAPESSEAEISAEVSEGNEEISEIVSETSDESSVQESLQIDEAEGYFFDDEQIVEDYHTAETFTDDEEFNALFQNNRIDQSYDEALKEAANIAEMRQTAAEYAEKWKEQAQSAYERLKELLTDNPQELNKLEESQTKWLDSIAEKEAEFYDEELYGELGSQALLSADSAMLNYYKGRAAVLYQQIFVLTGNMEIG